QIAEQIIRERFLRSSRSSLITRDASLATRVPTNDRHPRNRANTGRGDPRYHARMPHSSWNDSYASGEPLPWDTGTPDPMLVEMIESRAIAPGRTLEVGCGTGTNAIYLAQHGFDVVGVDISAIAVETARAKAHGRCRFETVDVLNETLPGGPFQ